MVYPSCANHIFHNCRVDSNGFSKSSLISTKQYFYYFFKPLIYCHKYKILSFANIFIRIYFDYSQKRIIFAACLRINARSKIVKKAENYKF